MQQLWVRSVQQRRSQEREPMLSLFLRLVEARTSISAWRSPIAASSPYSGRPAACPEKAAVSLAPGSSRGMKAPARRPTAGNPRGTSRYRALLSPSAWLARTTGSAKVHRRVHGAVQAEEAQGGLFHEPRRVGQQHLHSADAEGADEVQDVGQQAV
eukprot:CAMPEP_0195140846 /NCGR_PEP_ID=MMETSP0448-20130528/161910_1 /TAXON_ID=66468 /ORGANISM="Heterocapsa triquestra, Strain CCMP 448" /LENGTH=155 /DNA_ID=CAMNT_0040179211 /DNA_START=401 /DNA_END=869 /DNA_ORIENTATION=-